MGKRTLATMIVAVVTLFAGYNVYQSQNTVAMSDLALANMEALADSGESSTIQYQTMGTCTMWGGITYRCTTKYTAERCRLDCAKN